jgi:hypothetical protein
MKKLLTILLAAITLLIISPKPALAANLNIECVGSPSGCSQTGNNPLFSEAQDGLWYPGRELTKTINLKNSSSDTRQMALKATQTSISDDLKQVMSVSLLDSANIVIWSGTMSDFYNQGGIVMGTFNSGENKDYYFTATMDSAANNDYQGLETKFDLTLGFWGDVVSSPSNPSGHGDGLSDGRSDGLSDGRSSTPSLLANVLGVATSIFQGGQKEVLGTQTQEITGKTNSLSKQSQIKEVLGEQANSCTNCLWWQIILGEVIILLFYYWLIFSKKIQSFTKRKFLWALLIPVITYLIFLALNRGCLTNYFIILSKNIFCQWFWLIDLGVYGLISYGWKRFSTKAILRKS